MTRSRRVWRCIGLSLTAVLSAACSDTGPMEVEEPEDVEVYSFPSVEAAQAAAACRVLNVDATIDRLDMNPLARLLFRSKVRTLYRLSAKGPSPTARAVLGEVIRLLLERASSTDNAVERERILNLISILFCVLGEQPPDLDLEAGGAAIVTARNGATVGMPCLTDCPPEGGNLAALSVPANALPPGVPFVLVSVVPTTDPLLTDLPTRGPNFRISTTPAVELTRSLTLAACLEATELPPGSELLLARAAESPDEDLPPGAEQVGNLAIIPDSENEAAFAGLGLVCEQEETTPASSTSLLELLLPRPLHAQGPANKETYLRGIVAPGPRILCNAGCIWGGVIRLQRAVIALSPSTVTFATLMGGEALTPDTVDILNSGLESVLDGVSVGSITYGAGASDWLTLSLAGTLAPTRLVLSADPTGLEEGVYTATVPVAAPHASNSPQTVTVTLQVNGIPAIALESTSASFTAIAGEPDPPAFTIPITNGGAGTLNLLSAAPPMYGPGATNWLSAVTGSSAPTVLTLTPRTVNVAPGTYTATVQVRSSVASNSPQTVNVTLTVEEAPPSALRFTAVSSYQGRFVCALSANDSAYCWGPNHSGQLGDGTTINRLKPTEVVQPPGVRFTQISTGYSHTCALGDTGQAYCWGDNTVGALGSPPDHNSAPVTAPRAVVQGELSFVQIAAGNGQTCALDASGQAYCWGNNANGLLGVGVVPAGTLGTLYITRPRRVIQPEGLVFTSITAGLGRICAVSSTGQAWCWGMNHVYQLGDGTTEDRALPTAVAQPSGVVISDVSVGGEYTCALTTDGEVYCWGRDHNGDFGLGVAGGDYPVPVPAATTSGPWRKVDAGGEHTCGINMNWRVFCWGSPQRLGTGTPASSSVPVEAVLPAGQTFVDVVAGSIATCAISDTNELYCWGGNTEGSVGDGTTINRWAPVRIE